jgi:hypothetical protein
MSFAAIAIGGAVVAGAGTVGGIISRSNANKAMRKQMANRPTYQADEYTKQRLGLAQTQLNSRMAGASQAERNIQQQQATAQANINRAATDPNAVIAGAGAIQAQTNKSLENLGLMESQDYQTKLSNLVGAQGAMSQERQKEFEYNVAGKWQDMNSMQAAIAQNRANSWKDVTGLGTQAASIGLSAYKPSTGKPVSTTYPSIAEVAKSQIPQQSMMWGTGGDINNAPVLGGSTPNMFRGLNAMNAPQVPQQYNPSFFPTSNSLYNMYSNMSNMFPASYGYKK